MAIRETLELDLTKAQQQIDKIEATIDRLGKPVSVPVDVKTEGITQAETDSEKLRKELGKVEDSADKAAASGKKIGTEYDQGTTKARTGIDKMSTAIKALASVGAGYAVLSFAKEAVARAEELNSAYAITETVIRQTGSAANVTSDQIKELSKQESLLTGQDKALITEGNNVLLTFKNIRNVAGEGNDVFTRTSKVMLDVATVMGTDAKSAALQLAKALNDPIGQLGALSRSGVTFNAQQKEQIKSLAQTGDLLGAQKIILAELESEFGGSADAAANATDKIHNIVLEIVEGIGTTALPYLDQLATSLQKVAQSGGGLASTLSAILRGLGLLGQVVGGGIDVVRGFRDVVAGSGDALRALARGDLAGVGQAFTDVSDDIDRFNSRFSTGVKLIAEQALIETISKGGDAVRAFGDAIVYISRQDVGDLVSSFQDLAFVAGLSNNQVYQATLLLIKNADKFGLTADQVAYLKTQLVASNQAWTDGVVQWQKARDTLGDLPPVLTSTAILVESMQDRFDAATPSVLKAQTAMDKLRDSSRAANSDFAKSLDAINGAPEKIKISVKDFVKNLTTTAQQETDFQVAVAALATRGYTALAQKLQDLGPSAVDVAKNFLSNLDLAAQADTVLQGQGIQVAQSLLDQLDSAIEATPFDLTSNKVISALTQGMTAPGALDALAAATYTLFRVIAGVADDPSFDWGEVGYTVGAGIAEGYEQYWNSPDAYYKAASAARAIERAVKSGLKIQSPSKVFYEIGELSAEGLLQGFSSRLGPERLLTGVTTTSGTATAAAVGGATVNIYHPTTTNLASDAARAAQTIGAVGVSVR